MNSRFTSLFFLVLMGLFVSSCSKSEDHFTLDELTNDEVVDFIKLNFLEQYGGIGAERIAVCEFTQAHVESCELDTLIGMELNSMTNAYSVYIEGDFSVECPNSLNMTNDRIVRYNCEKSSGSSSLGDVSQEFVPNSRFTIPRKLADQSYSIGGQSSRNITFVSDKYKHFRGWLTFGIGGLCNFNFDSFALTEQNIYTFRLRLTDKMSSSSSNSTRTVEGEIKLINSIWNVIFDDGNAYPIE